MLKGTLRKALGAVAVAAGLAAISGPAQADPYKWALSMSARWVISVTAIAMT